MDSSLSSPTERPHLGSRNFLGTLAAHVEQRTWTDGLGEEDVEEVKELNRTLQAAYHQVLSTGNRELGEAIHGIVVIVAAQEIKIRRMANIVDDHREQLDELFRWANSVTRG